MPNGTKTYKVGQDVYNIPDEKSASFLKTYPNAVQVQSYTVDKDTFDIPLPKVNDFVKAYPSAKPIGYDSNEVKQQTNDFANAKPPTGQISNQQVLGAQQHISNIPQQTSEQKDIAQYGEDFVHKQNDAKIKNAAINTAKKQGLTNQTDIDNSVNNLLKASDNGDLAVTQDAKGQDVLKPTGTFYQSYQAAYANAVQRQAENAYLSGLPKDKAIEYLNQKRQHPELFTQEQDVAPSGVSKFLGQQQAQLEKPIVGGIGGAALAPETGGASFGTFVSMAKDAASGGYSEALEKNFNKIKDLYPEMSDNEAYDKAHESALVGETLGLGTAAFLSGKLPTPKVSLEGVSNALSHTIKSAPAVIGSSVAASVINDLKENDVTGGQGVNWDEIKKNAESNASQMLIMHLALNALPIIASGRKSIVQSYARPQIENAVASADRTEVAQYYQNKENNEEIPQGTTAKVLGTLSKFDAQKQIVAPFRISEENKAAIAGKLVQKQDLLDQRAALKPNENALPERIAEIDKQISGIDGEINKLYNAKNVFEKETDTNTGEKSFEPKTFEELKPQEKDGIIVPKDYGETDVTETGEGDNKTFKAKAFYREPQGSLVIRRNIPIEDNSFTDKDKAQQAAENALKQHYYDNGLHDNAKPDKKIDNGISTTTNTETQGEKETKVIEQKGTSGSDQSNERNISNESSTNKEDVGANIQSQKGDGLSGIESFETSKGSKYTVLPDGKTQRFKTASNEQKEPQDLTVFAKFKEQESDDYLHALHGVNGESVHVVGIIDGKVQQIKTNEDAAKATHIKLTILDKEGKVVHKIDAALEPKVGYSVYDQKKVNENQYQKHIGNEVSKINYKSEPNIQQKEGDGLTPEKPSSTIPIEDIQGEQKQNIQDVNTTTVKDEGGNEKQIPITNKTENNASTQSSEQQQTSLSEGGKPKHEGTEQAISETKTTSPESSNSNIGSKGKEKIGDAGRKLAEKIRSGKISKLGGFKTSTGFDAVWDASLEIVAKTLEEGAALADAIEEGLKHFRNSDWYKNLTDKKDFEEKYTEHLNNEYNGNDENLSGIKKAITEPQRAKLGLPSLDIPKMGGDAEVLQHGKDLVESGQVDIKQVVDDINSKKKAINEDEAASLQYYMHQLNQRGRDIRSAFYDADKQATDNPTDFEAQNDRLIALDTLNQHNDELNAALDAARRAGNTWGKVGRTFQIVSDESYSPVNIRKEIDANYGGEAPKDVKDRIDAIIKERDAATKEVETLKAQIVKLKEELAGKASKKPKTKEEFQKERTEIINNIKDKWKNAGKGTLQSGIPFGSQFAAIAPDVVKLFGSYAQEAGQTVGSIVANIYDDIKDHVEGITKDDIHGIIADSQAEKLNKTAEKKEERLANGDITSKGRSPKATKLTEDLAKAQQRVANADFKLRNEQRKSLNSRQSKVQRAANWLIRWNRRIVLSGVTPIQKIATAGAIGDAAMYPVKEGAGFIWSKIFPTIAKNAPIEGYINAKAMGEYYKRIFDLKRTVQNTKDIFRTGSTDLSKRFKEDTFQHYAGYDALMDIHSILKDPFKEAEFKSALTKATVWAAKQGWNISDPLVSKFIETMAFKKANEMIFNEDNPFVNSVRQFVKNGVDKNTEKNKTGTAEFVSNMLMPVGKVPTNIVKQLGWGVTGVAKGLMEARKAYREGIHNLSPEQADHVLKMLKAGTIGNALLTVGALLAYSNFGGNYNQDEKKKRSPKDLQFDEGKIGNFEIPKYAEHALPLQLLQTGATVRRINDYYRSQNVDIPSALGLGIWGTGISVLNEIPAVNLAGKIINSGDPYDRQKLINSIAQQPTPQMLKDYAKSHDVDANGNPIVRKPTGALQAFEETIPALRQNVPENPVKYIPKSEQDKPVWKFFTDKGAQLPTVNVNTINDLKDKSDAIKDKFANDRTKYIEDFFNKAIAANKKYSGKDENGNVFSRVPIKNMTTEQLTSLRKNVESEATEKIKYKMFKK